MSLFTRNITIEEAQRLIQSGANVNAKDDRRDTPLHWACHCRNENPKLAELLIRSGAEVDVDDNYGSTPLHWACDNNNPEFAELLIRSGADVYAMNPIVEKCMVYLKSYIVSRLRVYEEALIVHSWHPKRVLKWCGEG